jgi:hypothetical protein
MHAENRVTSSAFDAPLVGAPSPCELVVVVVADGNCATPEDVGLLPQPAAVTARLASATEMRMRNMVGTPLQDGRFAPFQK